MGMGPSLQATQPKVDLTSCDKRPRTSKIRVELKGKRKQPGQRIENHTDATFNSSQLQNSALSAYDNNSNSRTRAALNRPNGAGDSRGQIIKMSFKNAVKRETHAS